MIQAIVNGCISKSKLVTLLLLVSAASCREETSKNSDLHDLIVKEVSALQEAKLAEQSIDSFRKATGVPVEMTIEILDSSVYNNDSPNTVLAFINRSSAFERKILYVIKFDKKEKEIVSVEKN